MGEKVDAFRQQRQRLNDRVLAEGTLHTQRFFALDSRVYEDGAISARQKELMGLVASIVMRCNDCITYHVLQCAEAGVTLQEFVEALDVALIVGGSITIPHLRHAHSVLEELEQSGELKRA